MTMSTFLMKQAMSRTYRSKCIMSLPMLHVFVCC